MVFSLIGCGQIGLGGGTGANESTPSGTILATGTFEALSSSYPVSGLVQIINSASSGTNIIHLESFSAPTSGGLELRAVVNGTDTRISALRSATGDMNYTTTFTGTTPAWTSVSIQATSSDETYGTAVLR
jgi:hypothetical protein